jgi:hypothetical protein
MFTSRDQHAAVWRHVHHFCRGDARECRPQLRLALHVHRVRKIAERALDRRRQEERPAVVRPHDAFSAPELSGQRSDGTVSIDDLQPAAVVIATVWMFEERDPRTIR